MSDRSARLGHLPALSGRVLAQSRASTQPGPGPLAVSGWGGVLVVTGAVLLGFGDRGANPASRSGACANCRGLDGICAGLRGPGGQ